MKIRFAVGPPAGPVPAPDLISFAVALEANGFDGIWLSDLPVAPVLDPLLGLALLAGRTRTLRLGANIVPFGRSPYVLAKALAQLDQLSALGRTAAAQLRHRTRPGRGTRSAGP
jgi:alkanesulfonate monooxygenase SsuD/methylene tetrahydromethanopterin reductase-like flavin-dependent oxidoreductase (luciferase family)